MFVYQRVNHCRCRVDISSFGGSDGCSVQLAFELFRLCAAGDFSIGPSKRLGSAAMDGLVGLWVMFKKKMLGYRLQLECWQASCLPSAKRLHNYGKSPCSMGKSTISMGHGFNSYVTVITRGYMIYLCKR